MGITSERNNMVSPNQSDSMAWTDARMNTRARDE
jgi:hypothetical protein